MKAVANKFHGVQNLSQYKNDCDEIGREKGASF